MLWAEIIRATMVIICHTVLLSMMSQPKPVIRHPVAFWIGLSAVLELAAILVLLPGGQTFLAGTVLYIIFLVVYLVAFMLVSDGFPRKNLFIFLLYVAVFMLAAAIATLIGQIFFNSDVLAITVIRTLFSTILTVAYALKLKEAFRKVSEDINKGWRSLIAFEIVSFVSISIIAFTGSYFIRDKKVYLVVVLVFFFFFITSHYLVFKIIGLLNEKSRLRLLMVQQNLLENELEAEKEFVFSAKRFHHDMKKHNEVLSAYLNEGRIEEAKSYLSEYESSISSNAYIPYCLNPILNALLKLTERRCLLIEAGFRVDIKLPEDIPISRTDMVIIFGNLLENAYEACSKVEKPFISISSEIKNNSIQFEIKNSVDGVVAWQNDIPKTTKENGGTGVRNVVEAVSRYGGMLDLSQDEDVFISRVIIPL